MKSAERLIHIKEYYFSSKLKEVRRLVAQGKPIINMGIGRKRQDNLGSSEIGENNNVG